MFVGTSSVQVAAEIKSFATFLSVSDTDLENTWTELQDFQQQQQKNCWRKTLIFSAS